MKRSLLFLIAILFAAVTVNAQNAFNKGDGVLSASVGFGSSISHIDGTYKVAFPPTSIAFDYGIVDNLFDEKSSIGVGGYIGYTSRKWETYGSYSDFIIGARGTFHYQLVKNLDTYAAIILGIDIYSNKYDFDNEKVTDHSTYLAYAIQVGARYYFTNNFAAMAELGYGIAYFNIGVAFKF